MYGLVIRRVEQIFFFFFSFLQLANTEEYIDGSLTGHLGEVLIR